MRVCFPPLALCALLFLPFPARADQPAAASDLNNQAIAEAKEGHLDHAAELLRQACALNPNDSRIQKNLSLALTDLAAVSSEKSGGVEKAFGLLQEAVALFSGNGLAWVRLGDLDYLERNDFSNAVEAWKKANGLIPEQQWQAVAARISQAERDQSVERQFATETTDHFQVRFPSPEHRPSALEVGSVLERRYQLLAQELGDLPARVTVILYRTGEFKKISSRFDWALGFYDGRIRMRLEDVGTRWEENILAHEMAHAFLHKLYGSHLPVWVHEGYAQLKEPERPFSAKEQEIEAGVSARTLWVPLKWLDLHFQQPTDRTDVDRSYAEARIVVRFLMQKHGPERFKNFLSLLASGEQVSAAFDRAFSPSEWAKVEQGIFT